MSRLTPRIPVVKKLIALSYNECAYRSCGIPLVQEGMFVGDIAHIHAASEKGPRYIPDPLMSDEERRGFDNLMILCLSHHRVVDSKDLELKYPAELLREMKAEHEGMDRSLFEAPEDVVRQIEERITIEATQNNSLSSGIQYNTQTIVNIAGDGDTEAILGQLANVVKEDEPVNQAADDSDDDGILDKIADAEEYLPLWSNTIDDMNKEITALGAIVQNAVPEIKSSDAAGRGVSGRVGVLRELASKLEGVTLNIEHLGVEYDNRFSVVNKGIEAILELAEMQPEQYHELVEFLKGILDLVNSANMGIGQVSGMLDQMKPTEVLSKDMKRVLGRVKKGFEPTITSLPRMNAWAIRINNLQDLAETT